MPTLVDVEGFEHQVTTSNSTTTMNPKLWDTSAGAGTTLSFVTGRSTGGTALRVDENAANAGRLLRNLTTAGTMMVASFYVKLVATPSGVTSRVFHWTADGVGQIQVNTSGQIIAAWATGTSNTPATGPSINDGLWHLVDVRVNSSPATHTIEWTVDGSAQSNATSGLVAASNIVSWAAGTSLTSGAATFDIDDIVISVTSGDYAMGAHTVYDKVPASDGTHSAGSNIMERASDGVDIGTTTAYDLLNVWPPPQSGIDQASVTSSASGASNYAEVNFESRPSWATSTAWGVTGVVCHQSDTTGANTGISRIVAGATTTDIFSGDMSETSKHYTRRLITAPAGGWTTTNLDAAVGRVGFGTLQPGAPEWLALMLQIATPDVAGVDAAVTPTTVAGQASIDTPTRSAGASTTPTTVVGQATIPTPVVVAGTNVSITPTTVAAITAIATPTVTAGASVTPTTVAAVAAVATPTVTASSSVTLTTVISTTIVGTPTVAAGTNVSVTPSTVIGQAFIASTLEADATLTTDTVVALAAIATPVVAAGATLTTSTVVATAFISTPTVTAEARAPPAAVVAVAAIPTPGVVTTANASVTPTTVGAIAAIATPSVSGGATVTLTTVVATASIDTPTVDVGAATGEASAGLIFFWLGVSTPNVDITTTTINAPVVINSLTVEADSNVTPTTVAAVASVPVPVVTAGTGTAVTPTTVVAQAFVAATLEADADIVVGDVAAVASVPTVVVTISTPSVSVTPATVEAFVGRAVGWGEIEWGGEPWGGYRFIDPPIVTAGSNATVGNVAATTTVPGVTITATVTASVVTTTVVAQTTVPGVTVTVTALSLLTPTTVAAAASVPGIVILGPGHDWTRPTRPRIRARTMRGHLQPSSRI